MKIKSLLLFALFGLMHSTATAQIIGDEALRSLQNQKQTNILEGEIVAFLEDSTSPEYFREEFARLRVEISHEVVEVTTIRLVNEPPDSTLERLYNHPRLLPRISDQIMTDFNQTDRAKGLTEEELAEVEKEALKAEKWLNRIEFKYSVTTEEAIKIMTGFRNVAYQIQQEPIRQVNLKTEPGNEEAVMKLVEQLPFVKSTAFIGMIGE
jgi:hypothetical protein